MTSRSVVLAYHAVGPAPAGTRLRATFVPDAEFERQMDWLARHRRVVPLSELASDDVGGAIRVAITFDDGYRSVLTHAAPVLERHGFSATVFVPTHWLGDRNRWDGEDLPDLELMTGPELVELAGRGFEIASHGHRHIDMSMQAVEAVREDVEASVARISELLGGPPRHLSYPYGRSSEAARDVVRDCGFAEAFALEWEDRRFARSRTPVFPGDTGWRFALKSSGAYAPLRRSRPVAGGYRILKPLLRRRRRPSPERLSNMRAPRRNR
jgi:peptidoglycan/xylan/chitin deacetylase (PgdA/CDA1 family)